MTTPTITIAYGDGIGEEIMKAVLKVLKAADAKLNYEEITIGKKVYESGVKSGIPHEAWDSLRKNKVFLKAPITTPQGGGYKSLNVTIRKSLGLFANVRPVQAYSPFVHSNFPKMNIVVVRENEEDLYAGIEHQQTPEVVQCLKLISRPGSEKISHYAFEYAQAYGRNKVTCMSKDNIMKLTDGTFREIFEDIAKKYPDIEHDHYIIDIGSALIADQPERFDVILTSNLYGDIISDITAQISGSVGLGGSANIGHDFAMFEAIHGSAPDIAGQNKANPSGLLQAACMMLVHLQQPRIAEKIQNAWLKTLEDGIHTGDIYSEQYTKKKVGTREFADAVIERFGQKPDRLKEVKYASDAKAIIIPVPEYVKAEKRLVGSDIFIDWSAPGRDPNAIGSRLDELAGDHFKLKMITNRGVKVYPDGFPETFCTDHWRCRFIAKSSDTSAGKMDTVNYSHLIELIRQLTDGGMDVIKTENLYEMDGKRAYSLGQGE